jgi:hypothetical protein
MVIDEAHCLKDPTGKRYKNLDKFKTEKVRPIYVVSTCAL